MMLHLTRDVAAFLAPPCPFDVTESDQELRLSRQWWLEIILSRIRWGAVPVLVALASFSPAFSRPLLVLLAVAFGLGNALLTWMLRQRTTVDRLRTVRGLATGLDWAGAVVSIAIFSVEPAAATPAILLVLVLTSGIRFGLPGTLAATIGAGLVVSGLIAAQLWLHQVVDRDEAETALATWAALLIAGALINGTLLAAGESRRRWEFGQWEAAATAKDLQLAAHRREQSGLSKREWDVLVLLDEESLTYDVIAQRLHISPETVKTHVHRIGEKFSVHGRHEVVAIAKERGLLMVDEHFMPRVDSD